MRRPSPWRRSSAPAPRKQPALARMGKEIVMRPQSILRATLQFFMEGFALAGLSHCTNHSLQYRWEVNPDCARRRMIVTTAEDRHGGGGPGQE